MVSRYSVSLTLRNNLWIDALLTTRVDVREETYQSPVIKFLRTLLPAGLDAVIWRLTLHAPLAYAKIQTRHYESVIAA